MFYITVSTSVIVFGYQNLLEIDFKKSEYNNT
jgi:hypothetical protein